MNKIHIPIAIVIYPNMGILNSDIAGMAAGEYLPKELSKYGEDRVTAVTNYHEYDDEVTLFNKFSNLKIYSIADIDLKEWCNKGVLIIDSRAWLSSKNLENIFSLIADTKTSIQFCESPKYIPWSYRDVMTLAIYVSPEKVTNNLFKKMDALNEMMLEAVINFEVLDIAQKIYFDDECFSQFSLLITSYVDVDAIEQHIYLKKVIHAMQTGVRIKDPQSISIRGNLSCGFGVEIDANVIFEGDVVLGDNVKINANSVLRNCRIGNGTVINPFSLIEQSSVGEDGFIGPFGRIRPGCVVGNKVQIGNYVEIKNSSIGNSCRINHHAFIGDSQLADRVTIGAGTITCNHDGSGISETIIEQGAYIGSGCNLVAPLNIGAEATIGAGSTITKDVPAAKLTLARSIQTTVHGWVRSKNQREGK
jgi:acyl-[acyl carrier protein]--UDP-N-acetylglucosamine O-acyltransferase